MKRFLSLVLAAVMLVPVFCFLPKTDAAVTHGFTLGDANDDLSVSMKDVLLMRRYIAGLAGDRDIDLIAADVMSDNSVDAKDVLKIRRSIAGLDTLDGNNTDNKYKVDNVMIGDANIVRYTVVLDEDADPCLDNASEVFCDRIKRACGIKLNVAWGDEGIAGRKIKFMHDNDDEYDLGSDGFRIEVADDGDLLMWCGRADEQRGAMYMVYHFLEEFVGYRFLIADDLGSQGEENGDVVYLYESERAAIPAGYEETVVPKITYRALSQRGRSNTNFSALHINDTQAAHDARYGWRVGTLYIHAHSYAYQMAGIEHAYDNKWIEDHGLHATQPCLTAEETYEKIVEFNTWLIEDRVTWGTVLADGTRVGNERLGKTYTQVSCSPNDNTDFCQCAKCKAVYAEEGSISGTVFRLANRVSEKLEETYPTVETYTIAYWDARRPPKITRPRDSVCVCYCIGGCNNHPYDNTELCAACGGNPRLQQVNWDGSSSNSSNVDDIRYYLEWTELTNNIQIWYYSCLYTYYISPAANIFNIYNDIKFLAETGTEGVYFEGSGGAKYCFEYLRGYLATRMMWDPYMSEEEFNDLLNEFLWIFYGDGWQFIREYLEMANYASDLEGCWTNNFDRPFNIYSEDYFREHYKEMAVLFDKAYDAAETSAQKKRVSNCRMQCDFLGLSATFERDWKNGDEAARNEYRRRYVNLYNYIVNNGVKVAGLAETATGCENFPQTCSDGQIISPIEWLWRGCNGRWNYIDGRWQ